MKENKDDKNAGYLQNLRNDWSIIKVHLLEQFTELTEADLYFREGREEELLNRLGQKLGKNREEVVRLLQDIYLSAPKSGTQLPDKQKS